MWQWRFTLFSDVKATLHDWAFCTFAEFLQLLLGQGKHRFVFCQDLICSHLIRSQMFEKIIHDVGNSVNERLLCVVFWYGRHGQCAKSVRQMSVQEFCGFFTVNIIGFNENWFKIRVNADTHREFTMSILKYESVPTGLWISHGLKFVGPAHWHMRI